MGRGKKKKKKKLFTALLVRIFVNFVPNVITRRVFHTH